MKRKLETNSSLQTSTVLASVNNCQLATKTKSCAKVSMQMSSKGLVKLGNIVAETLFLVMFPWVAKQAGNKQNVLLPQWQNEEPLLRKQMSYACVQ